jgi:hypothetical protein
MSASSPSWSIEVSRRFVAKQRLIADDSPGDGHALAFASRSLSAEIGAMRQSDRNRLHARRQIPLGAAVDLSEHHVLENGTIGQQVE